jgi:hypothetical protein
MCRVKVNSENGDPAQKSSPAERSGGWFPQVILNGDPTSRRASLLGGSFSLLAADVSLESDTPLVDTTRITGAPGGWFCHPPKKAVASTE